MPDLLTKKVGFSTYRQYDNAVLDLSFLSDLWRGKGIEWEEIGKENKVDICYLLLLSLS